MQCYNIQDTHGPTGSELSGRTKNLKKGSRKRELCPEERQNRYALQLEQQALVLKLRSHPTQSVERRNLLGA